MPENKIAHDSFYKTLFSNPEMVKELLLDFVPEPFVKDFDFSTLSLCSGAYVTPHLAQREDDIVWKLRWQGTLCYVYIIMEFQSKPDYWMALRMPLYTLLLWDKLIKSGEVKTGQRLPPVFPIVIYNGKRKWNCAVNVHDLIAPMPEQLARYQPSMQFFLLDEGEIDRKMLGEGFLQYVFRLELARDRKEFVEVVNDFAQITAGEAFQKIKKEFLYWLKQIFVKYELPVELLETTANLENATMIEETIAEWIEEWKAEGKESGFQDGLQKGIRQGKLEGMREGKLEGKLEGKMEGMKIILLELIGDKFGEIKSDLRELIDKVNEEQAIMELTKQLYKMNDKEDFFQFVKNQICLGNW